MVRAASAPRSFYDERFRAGYQAELLASGYDACVLAALRWALARPEISENRPRRVLDYGCGQGRFMSELTGDLPGASLVGADISGVALELARARFAGAEYLAVEERGVPAEDGSFDLILMLDVIEHVPEVDRVARELHRLLRPGGAVILTTPCANPRSIAWFFNLFTRGFEETADGYGRFATDEPAHLRRLRSSDARRLLEAAGLETVAVRWWGHVFTALGDNLPLLRSLALRNRRRIALLDWQLLRRAGNGAAMVVVARRTGSGGDGG